MKPKRIELQFAEDDAVYRDLKDRADKLGLSPRMYVEQLVRADYWRRQGVDVSLGVRPAASEYPDASLGEGSVPRSPPEQVPAPEAQPPARPGAANLARSFIPRPPGRTDGDES
jgi:hypothetical protein